MSDKRTIPHGYPGTANSGIFDAQAFTIGESSVMHTPAHFPDGNKVTAKCGTYGWVTEHDGERLARWASGYLPEQKPCKACEARA